ncbi:YdcF family protein [Bartonella bilalgolemii]|uniref:YdcF family protein n=1 Tax=Bartonella bilalgolemii TaxID=2942911 RepID=A0ABT0P7S3_9HYPH|nr:YdcF family protein [Bartonella sp. G70]MCL6229152.1 YdcF family protein [Bartonella sp. G70]
MTQNTPDSNFAHDRQQNSLLEHKISVTKKRKRFFYYLPPTVLFILIIILIFCFTFVAFTEKVGQLIPPHPLPKVDAIIVLTGGKNRIETGLELLQKKLGSRLLISGVNTTTHPHKLVRIMNINPRLFSCCVDIDHQAVNTQGNAKESAHWINKHRYKTLYIVTHDYHMIRSLLEFKYLMPNVNFIAYPIKQDVADSWIKQANQIRLLALEYVKNISVKIRIILSSL